MPKNNRQDRKFSSLHFNDPWREWVRGFKKRDEAIRDATRLWTEVWNYRNDLFPVRSVPVVNHPGYVTHDRNFFQVKTRGKIISKDLTDYFTEEHYNRGSISYGNAHELGEFFELALHEILVKGISLYAMEWDKTKINGRSYILPKYFAGMNPATVDFVNEPKSIIARQKFSWIAKAINTYFEYQDNVLKKDELMTFKHPSFYPSSPVAQSMKFMKQLRQGIVFGLWQGKANAEPTNYSLRVEKTRYQLSSNYFRKQAITRIKVKRIFNQPVGGNNVNLTTYYELYAYAEYKKYLNYLRDYFVKQFTDDLLLKVQKKNKIKSPLVLEYRGFATYEVIDRALKDFEDRRITVADFLEITKDDYDKNLF